MGVFCAETAASSSVDEDLTVSTLSLSNFMKGFQRDTAVGSAAQLPKGALASAVVAVPTVATKSVILISTLFRAFPKLGSSLEASPDAA